MDTLASAFHPMKLLFSSALVVLGFALVPLLHAQTAAPAKPGDLVNGDFSWREVEFKCDVPPGAVFCNVILGNTNKSNGTFDFRGASVRFR